MTNDENIVAFPNQSRIEARATEWIMLFEDDEGTPEERAAFNTWMNESDLHREAYNRFAALWGGMDRFEELTDDAASAEGEALVRMSKRMSSLTSRRSVLVRAAASLAVVVGAVAVVQTATNLDANQLATYETDVGLRELIDLPDGSQIELNTNSKVEIAYSRDRRDIRLVRGEAYFTVAENKKRPFSVYAGDGVVEAVGTAFSVRLRDQKSDVTVTEGRVALFALSEATPNENRQQKDEEPRPKPLLQVTAGQQVVFDKKIEHLEHVESDVIKRKLAWRDGMLAFSGEPLSEMVAEVSRYTDVKIVIEGDNLKSMPVAGYFKAGDVDAMLEAFQLAGSVNVEQMGPRHVRLTKVEAQ